MSGRRSFIKALAALPVVAKAAAVSAEPVRVDLASDVKVICPHCFELDGRGHNCVGYAAWKLENAE
jgi:hypothetical protein